MKSLPANPDLHSFGFERLVLLILMGIFVACNRDRGSGDRGPVAARVYDNYLYEDQLARQFSKQIELSSADSQQLRQNLIDQWIRRQLFFHKAKRNLSDSALNKDDALKRYYQDLIRYEYERQLIRERLDTTVSDSAIRRFYQENDGMFRLHEPLLRVLLLKVPARSPHLQDFRKWYKLKQQAHLDSLYKYAIGYQMATDYEPSVWKRASALHTQYGVEVKNWAAFLKSKTHLEQPLGQENVLFLHVLDYQLPGQKALLKNVRDQVRQLILSQRKTRLLERHREKVFREGRSNNEFEILRP